MINMMFGTNTAVDIKRPRFTTSFHSREIWRPWVVSACTCALVAFVLWAYSLRRDDGPSLSETDSAFISSPHPAANAAISSANPFMYYGQRKANSGTASQALHAVATRLNLSRFISCEDGVACDTYTVGSRLAAIMSGHFYFGDYLRRERDVDVRTYVHDNRVSCATAFRDPVKRLESCFYYRFYEERRIPAPCLNDIAVPDLTESLTTGRSVYGYGCLNEPFRIFSGVRDEQALGSLHLMRPQALSFVYRTTLRNLATCVPIVLGDRVSEAVAGKFFPQVREAFNSSLKLHVSRIPKCELDAAHDAAMRRLVAVEQRLFDAVKRRVEFLASHAQSAMT